MVDQFFSDLSKDLYGTRSLWAVAEAEWARFAAANPGVTPYVCDGYLGTEAEYEAERAPVPVEGVTLNGQPLVWCPVEREVRVAA